MRDGARAPLVVQRVGHASSRALVAARPDEASRLGVAQRAPRSVDLGAWANEAGAWLDS